MLQVRSLTCSFGSFTVFHDVSFDVGAGSACAVTGSNGVGKSTLLRCVIGAEEVDDGRVLVDGHDFDDRSPAARAIVASVIGAPASFPHLSVREHLVLMAAAHGVAEPKVVTNTVLGEVGLAKSADQLPVTLSSGQRHRLALASALVRPRRLLVLDEPEQHLDAAGREWLTAKLIEEKESGCAVLLVSHDPDLVRAVADETVDGDSWL